MFEKFECLEEFFGKKGLIVKDPAHHPTSQRNMSLDLFLILSPFSSQIGGSVMCVRCPSVPRLCKIMILSLGYVRYFMRS